MDRNTVDLDFYGVVHYDREGKPICAICQKSYRKVLSHVYQTHGITAYEYKKMFGLDVKKGIVSDDVRDVLRERVKENYDKVVAKNLLKGGEKSRFKSGGKGRTRDMVSEQTRRTLASRFKGVKNI